MSSITSNSSTLGSTKMSAARLGALSKREKRRCRRCGPTPDTRPFLPELMPLSSTKDSFKATSFSSGLGGSRFGGQDPSISLKGPCSSSSGSMRTVTHVSVGMMGIVKRRQQENEPVCQLQKLCCMVSSPVFRSLTIKDYDARVMDAKNIILFAKNIIMYAKNIIMYANNILCPSLPWSVGLPSRSKSCIRIPSGQNALLDSNWSRSGRRRETFRAGPDSHSTNIFVN